MTTYKPLAADDRVSTKTLLHEAIPITGTIVSGTYTDLNIQNFSHGMFQSVYDYPYLSSSANHIFDITFGTSPVGLVTTVQTAKKDNIYNQMAQVLMGYDKNGTIQTFDEDGNLTGGTKIDNTIFVSFSRLLVKDEIKKGSFEMEIGATVAYATPFTDSIKIVDYGAATSYKVNSPAGEYGILYVTNSVNTPLNAAITGPTDQPCGLIYYQAGVAVINPAILMAGSGSGDGGFLTTAVEYDATPGTTIAASIQDQFITASADNLRNRIKNIQFNNTIELNSTVYFCRAKHNEFNYSSNPTYLNDSQIRVKTNSTDVPISYITSIGLYSADNQLLAVGKFSEPVRKDSNIELTFRARLDY